MICCGLRCDIWCDVRSCHVVCYAILRNVIWCDVMVWCDVMMWWNDVMWCNDVIWCVCDVTCDTARQVMCYVMYYTMCCHVMWCDMWCGEICDAMKSVMWCDVMSCGMCMWYVMCCDTIYSVHSEFYKAFGLFISRWIHWKLVRCHGNGRPLWTSVFGRYLTLNTASASDSVIWQLAITSR